MRKAMMAVPMLLAVCATAHAAGLPQADGAEIARVITAQIDAFRHDDATAAFALASPGIRQKFGDSAHFLDAVRQAYPQVYRPRSFHFQDLTAEDGAVTQKVEVVGPDGALVTAVYDLEHESDGTWRISGCSLLKSALQET